MLCAELPPRIYESLKTLCCLANASEPLQAQEIAVATDLPPAQTAKILQLMTWAGFVDSRRGTKGGFWLIRPANAIHVTDVADFFLPHTPGHRLPKRDGLLKGLKQATARCRKEFARITVADLAKISGCERTKPRRVSMGMAKQQYGSPRQGNDGR
jgi:DNA-binding IscR family transcriptional regulator